MIYVENRKCKIESVQKRHPGARIFDLTSNSQDKLDGLNLVVFSPFCPHGGIPVPPSGKMKSQCVEGVWQGLKVFEHSGVDVESFRNTTMKNLKRTVRTFGKPLGHQYGDELLGYFDARMKIYIPTYRYVLENVPMVKALIEKIREITKIQDVVFLDYKTNTDVRDCRTPLSHAGLVKLFIEGKYPEYDPEMKEYTRDELAALDAANRRRRK